MNFKLIDALLSATNGFTNEEQMGYIHLKGAKNSTNNFYEKLKNTGLHDKFLAKDVLDEALVALETEYERQGFINGFRMGAHIMMERLGSAPSESWDPKEVGNWLSRVC